MRRTCVVAAVLATMAGCDSKTPTVATGPSPVPTPEPTPQVAELTVSGDGRFTALNQARPFTATARMTDGSARNVTADAAWMSSDPDVVTVSSTGEVTSVGIGLATISATHGRTGTADVSVPSGDSALIAGLYSLAFTAAPECSHLPDWARRREYEAAIDQPEDSANGKKYFSLTVQLQPALTQHFTGWLSGSHVSLEFPAVLRDYYYFGDPVFTHPVDDTGTYAVQGNATATKEGSRVVQLSGTLVGFIRGVDPVTNEVDCYSAHHQFALVRR